MSRLIDRLNRISQSPAQPMGFRTLKTAAPNPRMLLVASLKPAGNASLAGLAAGADAVLLNAAGKKLVASAVRQISGSLPEIPWGISLEDDGGKTAKYRAISGCDFVVFPAARQVLATPAGSAAGRILRVDASISEGLLRAINGLPVDAVLADDSPGDALTWQQLLLFQRCANLLSKPLLVAVPPKLSADELKAIWETGADGVVIEVTAAGSLAELRQAADKLPSRKKGKTEALLLRVSGETAARAETEEEPEEE